MAQHFTSFKLLIWNHNLNDLTREEVYKIQKKLDGFLLQIKETISIEFKSNGAPSPSKKENYIFISIDNKWVIEIQEDCIIFSYNHAYPDDEYSYEDFNNKVNQYIDELSHFFKLKAFRLGSIIECIIVCNQKELDDFKENEDIIRKSVRKMRKLKENSLSEPLNIVEEKVYDVNLALNSVHNSQPKHIENGYLLSIDINTEFDNKIVRFENNQIKLFLQDVLNNIKEIVK